MAKTKLQKELKNRGKAVSLWSVLGLVLGLFIWLLLLIIGYVRGVDDIFMIVSRVALLTSIIGLILGLQGTQKIMRKITSYTR